MASIIKIETIDQYNRMRGVTTHHPLVSVVDLSKVAPMKPGNYHFGIYAIYLKELKCGELRYGRSVYDYQEGTLLFISPGQVIGVQPTDFPVSEPKGWALLFHPALIRGTPLGRAIYDYSFFTYDVNEALHVSEAERGVVMDCFEKITREVHVSIDKHSRKLIASNIELLLNYCTRYYDRQFITRDHVNQGIVERFERLLRNYYTGSEPRNLGVPTVAYCAEALYLSANYFGDVIKRESGVTAQSYIQTTIIQVAQEQLLAGDKSVSELAYDLGFKYPQHFARLFKQKVGVTPAAYRSAELN